MDYSLKLFAKTEVNLSFVLKSDFRSGLSFGLKLTITIMHFKLSACYASLIMWFILENNTDFYRAMLCIRGPSVRPSVTVGVLLKRLNVGSHKQHHTIAHGLVF